MEAFFLLLLSGKGANDPHTRQIFAGNQRQAVQLALDDFEKRHRAAHHQVQHQRHQRSGNKEDQRQPPVEHHRHHRCTNHQKRRAHHQTNQHRDRQLELVDVVGDAGDERGGAEAIDLRARKLVDMGEQSLAHIGAHPLRRTGGHFLTDEGRGESRARHEDEQPAIRKDRPHIPGRDPVVDHPHHHQRGEQVEYHLDELA